MNKKADVHIVLCGCRSILKCAYQLYHLYFNKYEKKNTNKTNSKTAKTKQFQLSILKPTFYSWNFCTWCLEKDKESELKLGSQEANFDR